MYLKQINMMLNIYNMHSKRFNKIMLGIYDVCISFESKRYLNKRTATENLCQAWNWWKIPCSDRVLIISSKE